MDVVCQVTLFYFYYQIPSSWKQERWNHQSPECGWKQQQLETAQACVRGSEPLPGSNVRSLRKTYLIICRILRIFGTYWGSVCCDTWTQTCPEPSVWRGWWGRRKRQSQRRASFKRLQTHRRVQVILTSLIPFCFNAPARSISSDPSSLGITAMMSIHIVSD